MNLPKLRILPDTELDLVTCEGLEGCSSCVLFKEKGGRCSGCTPKHKANLDANFASCYRECNECAGYKVNVPAICCRSPMKNIFLTAVTKGAEDWNKPQYDYTERPRLSFNNKAVFYISSGGVNTIAPGNTKLVEDHEVVAVNLTRVWGSNGFYSKDLKDYLHLPKKTQLILMAMTLDDLLERAWNKESYGGESFHKVGLDAWMPLSFSSYPTEAHMHQYYQLLRTLLATERGQAWWTTGDHDMPGIQTDDLVLACVEKIPQMVFNTQFVSNENDTRFVLGLMKHYHELVDKKVAFWCVGASSPLFVANARRLCGKRDIYFMSAKPLYLASKGQMLLANGKNKKVSIPKHELLQQNFANFSETIRRYG